MNVRGHKMIDGKQEINISTIFWLFCHGYFVIKDWIVSSLLVTEMFVSVMTSPTNSGQQDSGECTGVPSCRVLLLGRVQDASLHALALLLLSGLQVSVLHQGLPRQQLLFLTLKKLVL